MIVQMLYGSLTLFDAQAGGKICAFTISYSRGHAFSLAAILSSTQLGILFTDQQFRAERTNVYNFSRTFVFSSFRFQL